MISYSLIKKPLFNVNINEHPYFLVTPSIIPTLTSICALFFVTEIVNFFYSLSSQNLLLCSFFVLFFILLEWFFNVAVESDFHTKEVQYNNKIAFMLFISTEVMFFFSLFWAFFHGSLSPAIAFDNTWPPKGISTIQAFGPPIWGTWVLWLSSIYAVRVKKLMTSNFILYWLDILKSFNLLLILATFFTICQLFEFYLATFSFREGLYGSIFYLLTGFHGIHVIIGTIFIFICYIRFYFQISREFNFQNSVKNFILKIYSFFIFKGSSNIQKDLTKDIGFPVFKKVKNLNNLKEINVDFKQNNISTASKYIYFENLLSINIVKQSNNNLISQSKNWWQPYHFSGLETAVWYWQFVDIVWIFVWSIIYVWGNQSFDIVQIGYDVFDKEMYELYSLIS